MKYSIPVKFIAIVLCALSLVFCAGGIIGIVVAEANNLYSTTMADWTRQELESSSYRLAHEVAEQFAAAYDGNCSDAVMTRLYGQSDYHAQLSDKWGFDADQWSVTLVRDGKVLLEGEAPRRATKFQHTLEIYYPSVVSAEAVAISEDGESWVHENGTEPYLLEYDDSFLIEETDGTFSQVYIDYYTGPAHYDAIVWMTEECVNVFALEMVSFIFQWRNYFIWAVLVGLLIFAVTLVYLCSAAGRHPGTDQVYPVALNRLPLDLYGGLLGIVAILLTWVGIELIELFINQDAASWMMLTLVGLCGFGITLLAVAFIFAFAAQLKTKGGFWWRRTVIGFLLVKLGHGLRWTARGCRAIFNLLPLVWQWLLAALLMALSIFICLILFVVNWGFWQMLWLTLLVTVIIGSVIVIGYWAYCMGTLLKGVRFMAQGGLHHQIPTRHLHGKFRDFAIQINSMAGAARIAAEQQLRSERMKTELITNVSHDIKTPLTSIINYVDLLKKPHTETDGQQYLDVLNRQSQRLKKLIEDLMEMSKASTGNIAVEMSNVDAVETVNQALGEFSDKLERVALTPVFRHPEIPVIMRADGKLVWRVMSNLLSNAVKYAMPGTRLYIELAQEQGSVLLSLKNVSREALRRDADELMERFVRGDISRNSEGSGLGLNIAKSLMEIQNGQMQLLLDGDLFKVTLIFPTA